MIKVTVIALGRLKEAYLQAAVDEYIKRLSRFCDLKIIELSPAPLPENPSESQINNALSSEAKLIEKNIPKNALVCSLCIEGKQMSSLQFAKQISKTFDEGKGICFVIGSSFGLSDNIKKIADMRLSLSEMTFPHQLFRVMLLEQIYRAFMINEGSKYHK